VSAWGEVAEISPAEIPAKYSKPRQKVAGHFLTSRKPVRPAVGAPWLSGAN
jgi:hypothetical protein